MASPFDRRSFLKIVGASLGYGALYRVAPALAAGAPGEAFARQLARANGEAVTPFSFVQLSDTHVGFSGPPNPTGTAAFERAVEIVNRLPQAPDLVLFTGDLTHDTEEPGEHAARMRRFQRKKREHGHAKPDRLTDRPKDRSTGCDPHHRLSPRIRIQSERRIVFVRQSQPKPAAVTGPVALASQ